MSPVVVLYSSCQAHNCCTRLTIDCLQPSLATRSSNPVENHWPILLPKQTAAQRNTPAERNPVSQVAQRVYLCTPLCHKPHCTVHTYVDAVLVLCFVRGLSASGGSHTPSSTSSRSPTSLPLTAWLTSVQKHPVFGGWDIGLGTQPSNPRFSFRTQLSTDPLTHQ